MMNDKWKQCDIKKVIALGRAGQSFDDAARGMKRTGGALRQLWHRYATPSDVMARANSLVRRQQPASPVSLRRSNVSFPPNCFTDDPRAVAERKTPIFMPARLMHGSGCGCSAAIAAFG